MDGVEQRLLNDFQRGLPLAPHPFAEIGARLGVPEAVVIAMLEQLIAGGKVSRVGATFVPGRIGAATLAAMSVPDERLLDVAEMVNAYPEVTHNYEREHRFNLWFVITGPDERQVDGVVREIERVARCGRVLSLPIVEPYHVDLGFDLSGAPRARRAPRRDAAFAPPKPVRLSPAERALVVAVQDGLPLTAAPYAELAQRAGTTEAVVMATLARWLEQRVVNRVGVIVQHRELGYTANAMVVWDVPNADVRAVGRRVAVFEFVTLCYRRLRHLPDWRYNLYCIIHGTDRDRVLSQIAELQARCELARYSHEVLFSHQRFKQRGARYLQPELPAVVNG